MAFPCSNNHIIFLRCCLAKEVGKYATKTRLGIDCSSGNKLMFKQRLLKLLMCINYDHLDKEHLTEDQIQTVFDYLFSNCKDCEKKVQ